MDVLRLATAKGNKVQKAGTGFLTRCPSHADNRPSLSIGMLDNGGVGLKCHAQCTAENIARAFGIELYQLSPEKPQAPHYSNGTGSSIIATYDYVDAGDRLIYRVHRKSDKGFPVQLADGTWEWPADKDRVLYRLPEVIEAVSLSKTVFVVEGEKDTDNLRALGVSATTNAGGAGKWRDDYSRVLKDADVVILPDNDAAGRSHAAKVLASLTGIAASARIVELPGLAEKGDVSDWIAAGGTAAKFLELTTAPGASPEYSGLPLPIRAIDIGPEAEKIRFMVKDFAIAGDYGLVVGEDGQFKTTIMIHLAGAVAAGGKVFAHFQVEDAGPVLIVSGEDPAGIIANRLRAFCRGHGWDERNVLENVHVLCISGEDLTEKEWRAHLVGIIERLAIRLVLLDPLRDLTAGEENNSTDMKPFNDVARALSLPTGATVFAGHHASKGAERSKTDRVRGSGGIRGASRRTLFIEDMPEEKAIKVESVKFSRMPKQAPFMVRRLIEADPANPAIWTLARFEYATAHAVEFDKAEAFIRDLLANGMEMNSSDIRTAAVKKVGAVAINSAIKNLEMRRLISHREGPNNSKLWRWVEPVSNSRQGDRPPEMPVRQADRLSDNLKSPSRSLSVPYRGDRLADRAEDSRQASFAEEVA